MEVLKLMFQAAHQLPHGLTDAAGYEYVEHDLKVKSFQPCCNFKNNFKSNFIMTMIPISKKGEGLHQFQVFLCHKPFHLEI